MNLEFLDSGCTQLLYATGARPFAVGFAVGIAPPMIDYTQQRRAHGDSGRRLNWQHHEKFILARNHGHGC